MAGGHVHKSVVRAIARTPTVLPSLLARGGLRAREPVRRVTPTCHAMVRRVTAKLAERRRKHGFRLRRAEPTSPRLCWSRGYGGHEGQKEVAFGHVVTSHADGVTSLALLLKDAMAHKTGQGIEEVERRSTPRKPLCGDPAPACAKRWRGACAVWWGRPADSVSAGIAGDTSKLRSRQRHHWGRWRGTPILHRGSVSNAGYNRSEALRWR